MKVTRFLSDLKYRALAIRACLKSRFWHIHECFFTRQGGVDEARPKLLLGNPDPARVKNKPKRCRNGDFGQALIALYDNINVNDHALVFPHVDKFPFDCV